ncbi:hypothetical protein GQ600_2523 [Phytophthora cactorum]|nr:hypothetical protein GQ600_2523 [Phytophthora cactorum]
MDPRFSPITVSGNMSLYNIGDIFNLPASMDLLDDEDFESTMMMLDNSAFRGEDSDNLELNLIGLSDAFNSQETGSPRATILGWHRSPRIKICSGLFQANKQLLKLLNDFGYPWSCESTPAQLSAPDPATARRPAIDEKHALHRTFAATAPPTLRTVSNSSTSSTVSSASSTRSKSTRRAKQCIAEGCTRRAQSNNRCKTHGGGARCQVEGCDKSSQGGGLCRAHGGGKKCRIPGCSKGTQRLGLCYLHGGIRRCIMEGCKKKDRGNGYCISHGGGRRCEAENCNRSVRKGNHCQLHQGGAEDTPFQISRGQGLTSS